MPSHLRHHQPRSPSAATFDVWRAHPGYAGAFAVDVTLATSLGGSALLSDPVRFDTPIYDFVREVGVSHVGWMFVAGAALLLLGALGRAWHTAVLLLVGALIYGTLAAWFGIAAWPPGSRASWWGVIFAACIGIWHVTQAAQYLAVRPPQPGGARG